MVSDLRFETKEGEHEPPITGEEKTTPVEEGLKERVERPSREGWVPLKPVAVTPILRLEGDFLAWRTGWPLWAYSERELQDIGELIDACGVTAPAWAQLIGALGGLHAAKFTAFKIWVRQGSPGAKEEVKGAMPPPEGR